MKIKVELTINKSIQEVWEVMGNQYGYADKWSSNFKTSKPVVKQNLTDLITLFEILQLIGGIQYKNL